MISCIQNSRDWGLHQKCNIFLDVLNSLHLTLYNSDIPPMNQKPWTLFTLKKAGLTGIQEHGRQIFMTLASWGKFSFKNKNKTVNMIHKKRKCINVVGSPSSGKVPEQKIIVFTWKSKTKQKNNLSDSAYWHQIKTCGGRSRVFRSD